MDLNGVNSVATALRIDVYMPKQCVTLFRIGACAPDEKRTNTRKKQQRATTSEGTSDGRGALVVIQESVLK
jgi:hypothetical protein